MRSIPGHIMEVISSVKSSSLMLLRHKEKENSSKSSLAMFYFKDDHSQSRWNVLNDLEDHQRVFQISLSNKFMLDLSEHKPMIGIYDNEERSVTILQLEPQFSSHASMEIDANKRQKFDAKEVGGYGTFKPVYKIENFLMKKSAVVRESGRDDFIYLAIDNTIYKFYVNENALKTAKKTFRSLKRLGYSPSKP